MRQTDSRGQWLWWVLGHTLFLGIALVLGAGFTLLTFGFGGLLVLPLLLFAPLVAQWIGIHRNLQPGREVAMWLGATAVAGSVYVAMTVLYRVTGWEFSKAISPAGLFLFGAMLGLAQWLVLRRHISGAIRWIPANAIGVGAGAFVGTAVAQSVEPFCRSAIRLGDDTGSSSHMMGSFFCQLSSLVLAFTTGTLVFSIITGTVLVWLLRVKREIRPANQIQGRYLALGAGIVSLVAVGFVIVRLLQVQADNHRANTFLQSVSMVSPTEGWAVGGTSQHPVTIMHFNGGKWTEVDSPVEEPLWSVYMLSADSGWAVGSDTTILRYQSGEWSKVDSPAGISQGLWLRGLRMVSADEGWAFGTGGYGDPATVLHYKDGSWTAAEMDSPPPATLESIYMLSADEGWAVGDEGTIFHYSSGRWVKVDSPTNLWLGSVIMVSADEGWAVGGGNNTGSVILHYSSGKWSKMDNPTDQLLASMSMVSEDEGWAVGAQGTILHYKGGAWSKVDSPTQEHLSSIIMNSSSDGWAVGDSSTILHYRNGLWSYYENP